MGKHIDSTAQHQIHDDDLEYADEAALAGASPDASLIGRVGHAISEDSYWILISTGPTVFNQIDGGAGTQGDTGDAGDTGAGAKGDTGTAGTDGATGVDGETGVAGDKGDTGDDSTVPGDTGIQGVDGDTGTAGTDGATGVDGETGVTGDKGDTGTNKGDTGVAGAKGDTGAGGGGDVTGPGSSTDHAHVRWDGAGGDTLLDGNFIEADDGSWVNTLSTAVTDTVSQIGELVHKTSGVPDVGFGVGLKFVLDAYDFEDAEVGSIEFAWDETYDTFYDRGRMRLYLNYGAGSPGPMTKQLVMHISNRGFYDASDGNERGMGAIEIQTYRNGVAKVAAGDDSMILGGFINEIHQNATGAIIIGGNNSTVWAAGDNSTTINSPNTIMDAPGGLALGGEYLLPAIAGELAFGNGRIGAAYAKQSSLIGGLRLVTHSDAAWYEIYTDTGTGQIVIPTDAALYIEGEVVGASSNMDQVFAFHVRCLVVNDDDVTSILSETVTIVYNADDTDITCRVTADDTNEAIMIEVQDSTSGSAAIRWGFTMLATRIQFN